MRSWPTITINDSWGGEQVALFAFIAHIIRQIRWTIAQSLIWANWTAPIVIICNTSVHFSLAFLWKIWKKNMYFMCFSNLVNNRERPQLCEVETSLLLLLAPGIEWGSKLCSCGCSSLTLFRSYVVSGWMWPGRCLFCFARRTLVGDAQFRCQVISN